jgi:hypothetical protein
MDEAIRWNRIQGVCHAHRCGSRAVRGHHVLWRGARAAIMTKEKDNAKEENQKPTEGGAGDAGSVQEQAPHGDQEGRTEAAGGDCAEQGAEAGRTDSKEVTGALPYANRESDSPRFLVMMGGKVWICREAGGARVPLTKPKKDDPYG